MTVESYSYYVDFPSNSPRLCIYCALEINTESLSAGYTDIREIKNSLYVLFTKETKTCVGGFGIHTLLSFKLLWV